MHVSAKMHPVGREQQRRYEGAKDTDYMNKELGVEKGTVGKARHKPGTSAWYEEGERLLRHVPAVDLFSYL